MFGLTRTLRTFSLRAWIAEQSRRQRLEGKNDSRDQQLAQICPMTICATSVSTVAMVERYIMDYARQPAWVCRPRR